MGSFPEMYNDIQRQPGFQIGVDRKGSSLFSEPCASLCTDAPSPKKISGIFSEGRGCLHTGQRNSNIMQINGFAAGHHACSQSTVTQKKKETARSLKSGLQGFVSVS